MAGRADDRGTGDPLDRLRAKGTVRLGIAGEPPFGYIDEDGEVTGEAPEIAKSSSSALGVDNVQPVATEFGALIPGLNQRSSSMWSRPGCTSTRTAASRCIFSDPDYLMLDSFIVPKGNPHGHQSYEDIAKKGLKLAQRHRATRRSTTPRPRASRTILDPPGPGGGPATPWRRAASTSSPAPRVTVQRRGQGQHEGRGDRGLPADGRRRSRHTARGGFAFRLSEKNLRDAFNRELHKLKKNGELLRIVKPFGFTKDEMTDLTAEELCG